MKFATWFLTASLVFSDIGACHPNNTRTFTNPILQKEAADPWVFLYEDGLYYMILSANNGLELLRSPRLTDWNNAESRTIFTPPPGTNYSTDIWAPELHSIDDRWYVIFTADPNNDSPIPEVDMLCDYNCPAVFHRMYVLEGSVSHPWEAEYTFKSQLDTYDQFAIDGTYFQHKSGLYHIYSCWINQYDAWPANLCITKMSNPWTVSSTLEERQILSAPTKPWEKTPYNRTVNVRMSSNEAPQQLVNEKTGQQFIIYSAARSDNRNYCLGQLELVGDDPMDLSSWKKLEEGPVFYQNPEEEAFGVGHASFTKSPDETEDWIVYHGMRDPTFGWSARTIRAQRFSWNYDGSPRFPRPGYGPYEAPSGQR
ncbi:alpha-N-arab-like proteininofuranosidase [Eremomyces bilateralis CBS 781.70]|uniref:Alpha-N-arab-like proteininofuranosidase n=1 Tax=Eremomyces bilateralis CBS 781.70 TaxID=1392243 RepID=A0A6G1FTE7_9PEZI|nr:alpha-N-arab-like proteininofuranosidase [Eremomyces bilateralis CBS 781.70]KAF1809010.1 alpha-N-arab-like proteininofuranosidase [Eremomyces bilateralis CBS 781.70]